MFVQTMVFTHLQAKNGLRIIPLSSRIMTFEFNKIRNKGQCFRLELKVLSFIHRFI